MAARIAKLLRATAESWLRMQAAVDLWELEQRPERLATVQPIDKRLLHATSGTRAFCRASSAGANQGAGSSVFARPAQLDIAKAEEPTRRPISRVAYAGEGWARFRSYRLVGCPVSIVKTATVQGNFLARKQRCSIPNPIGMCCRDNLHMRIQRADKTLY